ncbi:MAG: NAD-dependent epimerase/dehydratase family protein [Bradymonadia bacterium]
MKVVVTGASGALARRVIGHLVAAGHVVLGIDRRPWPDCPDSVTMHRVDIRKRPAEEIFRTHRPDAVIHMATVTYVSARSEERYRINLGGTRAVWEYCEAYGVKQAIFVGRHTVYGAAADAPLYRTEDEPLMAGSTFPNLADLVAADLYAGNAIWRRPSIDTAVLRLVYSLGPSRRGTLANYLRGPRVPTVMGFDPLFHFMHEKDAARAIFESLNHRLRGVFNVAGPPPVPLSLLCRIAGCSAVPIPEPLYGSAVGRFGFSRLPKGSLNHIKYPIVVDDECFIKATGFAVEFDEIQTLRAYRWR